MAEGKSKNIALGKYINCTILQFWRRYLLIFQGLNIHQCIYSEWCTHTVWTQKKEPVRGFQSSDTRTYKTCITLYQYNRGNLSPELYFYGVMCSSVSGPKHTGECWDALTTSIAWWFWVTWIKAVFLTFHCKCFLYFNQAFLVKSGSQSSIP